MGTLRFSSKSRPTKVNKDKKMDTNTTRFEVNDKVAWITLNRPEAMNSLNPELRWQLSEHLDEVERNDDIWLAIITGAGSRSFCAGADLKHRAIESQASHLTRLGNLWKNLSLHAEFTIWE